MSRNACEKNQTRHGGACPAIPAFLPSPLDASSSSRGTVAAAGGGSSKSFNAPSQPKPSTPIGHRAPGPRVTHNWAREQAAINTSLLGPAPATRPNIAPWPTAQPATTHPRDRESETPTGGAPGPRPRLGRFPGPGYGGLVFLLPAVRSLPGLPPTRGRRQPPGGIT